MTLIEHGPDVKMQPKESSVLLCTDDFPRGKTVQFTFNHRRQPQGLQNHP